MEFNVKKCKVLRVTCCKCISEREYFLGETKLEHVPIEKDLQARYLDQPRFKLESPC